MYRLYLLWPAGRICIFNVVELRTKWGYYLVSYKFGHGRQHARHVKWFVTYNPLPLPSSYRGTSLVPCCTMCPFAVRTVCTRITWRRNTVRVFVMLMLILLCFKSLVIDEFQTVPRCTPPRMSIVRAFKRLHFVSASYMYKSRPVSLWCLFRANMYVCIDEKYIYVMLRWMDRYIARRHF